jgi:rhodanese-related sulfurtransferase
MDHSPRFLRLVEEAKTRVKEISVAEVAQKRARGEDFDLIDVREESEWAAGHAKGARYLGRGVLERDVEKAIPDLDRELVLYCGGGFRSALSADSLSRMGYRRVLSLAGGWKAWKAAGGEIET